MSLTDAQRTIEELGMPPAFERFLKKSAGLETRGKFRKGSTGNAARMILRAMTLTKREGNVDDSDYHG